MSQTKLPDNKELQASTRSSIPAPVTPVHEAVVKLINDMISQQLQQQGITFGKVTGQDGGAIRVLVDGEDDPRQVGIPRHAGVQYPKGSRVAIGTTNSGDKFILGPVNDGQGKAAEALVGSGGKTNENIADDSVDTNHLRNNAVKNQHIDSGAVDSPQVKSNAITNDKLAPNSVDSAQLKGNSVNNAAIAPGAVDSNQIKNGAVGNNQLDNGIVSKINSAVQPNDLNDYAKKNDLDAYEKSNDHNADIKDLKSQIADLQNRVKKLESKGSN